MFVNNSETIAKANLEVEKNNQKFVSNFLKKSAQRHVVEENEPMLDKIISDFSIDYGKTVVASSMKDIVKFVKNS
jgi:hypothetical protein